MKLTAKTIILLISYKRKIIDNVEVQKMCLVSSISSSPENGNNGKRPIFQSQIHEARPCTKEEQTKKDWQRALF